TQIAPMMLPDLDIDDEAYAESTSTSYVTSIASEISRGILENERLYPQYGRHSYGMPVDEAEMDRMDLQHRKYELVIGDRHFLAPIGDCPQSILDLATGTGIWALDVADMFPTASVLGVDIAPIQPKWVAPNCQFEIDDIEDSWTYRMESFDFIHLRDPLYVVRDWPKLMRQAYDHLKPGGWFELASVYPRAMCDDASMPESSMFKFICDRFIEASYGLGAPLDCCLHFAEYLRNAGFVDVAELIFKMPSSPWPKDRRLKKVGALEMTNLVEGASAFGLRVFSHAYGWTREETELAMVGFRKDVKNRNYHQYVRYYVVYGRKPERRD
ncbi:S-adenosyl-L-methionine-dependent methyltransferase, partial [Exophiala viscosa]